MTCQETPRWNLSLARINGINFIARSALMGLLSMKMMGWRPFQILTVTAMIMRYSAGRCGPVMPLPLTIAPFMVRLPIPARAINAAPFRYGWLGMIRILCGVKAL